MISIDLSLVYQIIGFFVLLFVLNRLLYKPVFNILKQREEKIEGTLKKAEETETHVEEGLADYEKRLREAAVKGHEERARLRAEGQEREKEILEAARNEANKELSSMRDDLKKSKQEALASLKEEAKNISKDIAEKILERKVVLFLLAFLLPVFPELASAATEEHGGGGQTWKIINFIILAVGVYIAWIKGIKPMLEKRGQDIKKAMDEAREAKEAADKKALEYREKLSLLERKIAEIREELTREGEAEKERIMKDAEDAAQRVREQAKLSADHELKKARAEIRAEVGELAVKMAEEILSRELKPEDQQRLVKDYVDNLRLN